MNIPIANTFRLLAYAWDVVEEAEVRGVATEHIQAPVNALGHVLAGAAGDLIRRGIRREYVELDQIVAGVRGKLLIGATVKRNLLSSAHTACRVAKLDENTLANRLIRWAVRSVLSVRGLDATVRAHLEDVDSRLSSIPLVRPQPKDFHRVPIHRNNRLYRLVLSICYLICRSLTPHDREGASEFRDFRRDRKFMWRLFERFVFRFYDREQEKYRVSAPKVSWARLLAFDSDPGRLPQMRTDVVLRTENRMLVIDTKFYPRPLAEGRFGHKTIRSSHLYQLLTYLAQLQQSRAWRGTLDGMLLYPAVTDRFDLRYAIGDVGVRAVSLDLAASWPEIKAEMLSFLEAWRPSQ